MGRIRTIKPEFFTNESLSGLPAATHLLAAGLLTYADDEGYFNANPKLVAAAICPLREDHEPLTEQLRQLAEIGFIELGIGADGKSYGRIVKFSEHQRVNRPTPSKIKRLQIDWKNSVSIHGALTDTSVQERKGKEGKGSNMSETDKSDFGPNKPSKQNRRKYPDDFEEFWQAYPTDKGMSKHEAAKQWDKLAPEDREQATNAIADFKRWVLKQGKDYRTVHACRFLSQRRFEGFAATKIDTSNWSDDRWRTLIDIAERDGKWPNDVPPEKIPKHLIDNELRNIIGGN